MLITKDISRLKFSIKKFGKLYSFVHFFSVLSSVLSQLGDQRQGVYTMATGR